MGLADFFGKINEKMHGVYDKIVAFLDAKGIPAQKYTDFLEEKGIPAMWFTILVIAVIIAIIVLLVSVVFVSSVTITYSILTDDGTTPSSVFLSVSNAKGEILYSGQIEPGTKMTIKGVGTGESLFLNSSLEGYVFQSPTEVPIAKKNTAVTLVFAKEQKTGGVSFKVINRDEQTTITGAQITLYDSESVLASGTTDEFGSLDLIVPLKKVVVEVEKGGYELYKKTIELLEGKSYILELVPKEFDPNEEGSFKFIVKDVTQSSLNNVKIDIYNLKTNSKIGSVSTNSDGIAIFTTKKGTSIRFVASKEGFETYDSNAKGISRTLVTSEELISICLVAGGGKLSVTVTDALGVSLDNAYVALYTAMLLEQDSQITDMGGKVEFSGLDYTIVKYVSVYREGFYPQTKEITGSGEMTFKLEKVDLAAAAIVDLYAVDEDKKPVGNAKVDLSYSDGNAEPLPLAYPDAVTSVTGYLNLTLKPNITLFASAKTEDKYGESSLLLKQGRNRIDIVMKYIGTEFTTYLYDKDGKPLANAHVMFFDKQGNLIFDGYTDETGKITADALGNKELDMVVTDAEGNVYSQTIIPKDKQQIKLEKNKNKDKLLVSLSKITDLDGTEVSALQKGKTYYLVFNIFWPEGFYSGGLHVRVGSDFEKYAAAQDVGIIGFDGVVDDYKYGITYSPIPQPGDYSTDAYSSGSAGQFNKWLETYFAHPVGTSTIKVRIKTKATTDLNSVEIRYRAWMKSESGFTRTPVDNILGTEENVKAKYGLYADTFLKTVPLLKGGMNCQYDLCTSYTIIDDKYTYDIAKFNAVVENYYALDVELTSTSEQDVTLSVQTEDDAKLCFNNYEFASESFLPGQEKNTKLNVPVSLGLMEKKKIRFYFNTFKEGLTYIIVKSITPKGIIEKKINVNIFPKKEMSVILSSDFIPVGEDFYVIVKEGSTYIQNANITITDKKTQQQVLFIEGTGAVDKGKDGRYLIKNTLPSGDYILTAEAPGYLPVDVEFLIGNVGVLFIKGDNEIIIPKGAKIATQKIPVQNRSNFPVESMTVNVVNSTLSPNFTFSAKMVTPAIQKNSVGDLAISVGYNGTEERENGVVELEVMGVQNQKEITRVRTKVFVYYNKEIKNTGCLWVSKESLIYSLPAIPNAKIEDSIVVRNNCEYDLKVMPQLVSEDAANYGLQLQFSGFDIKKGEEKVVKFAIINHTPFIYTEESKTLSLYLNTDYFTKNIPVNITIWNASGSLAIMTAGHIFISAFKELQGQYIPVIIQNVGRLPIYNIQVMGSNNAYQIQPYNYSPNPYNHYLNSYSQLYQDRYNLNQYNNWRYNYGVTPGTYPLGSQSPSSGITKDYYANPNLYQNPYSSIYNSPYYGSFTYSGQGINFMPPAIQVLMPGQAVMLQGYVSMPATSKQTQLYYTIMARGTVEGINQPVTAQGYVVIHISPDKCVTLKQNKKLTFISEKLGVDIARTFTLINNCAEPVNIIGISESDLFGNKVTLSAPKGITIDVGQEKEFILTVNAAKEISRDNTLFIKGTLGISNAPFNLPITVNLRFGGGASVGTAGEPNVTEERRVKNCATGEEVTLFYPRITNSDCSLLGYCDSESMSKFLIAKLKYYLEQYNRKLSAVNNKLENTNCQYGSTACSFEDFGLEPLIFDVYFSNDRLTEAQMNADLKKSNIGLIETAITEGITLTEVTSTWTKRLYLDKLLDGCGKYKLKITGAVMVINNDVIQKDSYNMYIQVLSKEKTPQCDLKVQNALNYLPKDPQTKKDNPYGLRIGCIDYDTPDLSTLANKVSMQLFNQDRYLRSKPNTLYLKRDSVSEGNLVEFGIEQRGSDVVTIVKVNKNLDLGNEAILNDVVKAIMGFLYGNFDGCVTLTGQGVGNAAQVKAGTGGLSGKKVGEKGLTSEVTSGDIQIGQCDSLPLGIGTWSCNVHIKSQSLGRVDLVVTYPPDTGLIANIDDGGQPSKTIELTKQGNIYQGVAKISVKITDPFKVMTGANSDESGVFYYAEREGIRTNPIRIQFDPTCGIDGQQFIDKMMKEISKNEKSFEKHALIYNGEQKDSVNTCEALKNFLNGYKEGKGKEVCFEVKKEGSARFAAVEYKNCELPHTSVVCAMAAEATDPKKLGAASLLGFGVCMGTEKGLLKFLLGPIGWGAAAVDCAIFTGINVATEIYGAHRLKVDAGMSERNFWDGLHDTFASIPILSTILGLENYKEKQKEIIEKAEAAYKEKKGVISAGLEGVKKNYAAEGTAAVGLAALRSVSAYKKIPPVETPKPEVPAVEAPPTGPVPAGAPPTAPATPGAVVSQLTNKELKNFSTELGKLNTYINYARRSTVDVVKREKWENQIKNQVKTINKSYKKILKKLPKGDPNRQAIIKAYNSLELFKFEKQPNLVVNNLIADNDSIKNVRNLRDIIKGKVKAPTSVTTTQAAANTAATKNAVKVNGTQQVTKASIAKPKGPSKLKRVGAGLKHFAKGLVRAAGGGVAGTMAFYGMLDWLHETSTLDLITITVEAPPKLQNCISYIGSVSAYAGDSRTFKIYDSEGQELPPEEAIDNCKPLVESGEFSAATGILSPGGGGFKSEPTPYDALIIEAANKAGIEPEFLKAVVKHESDFNPNAISKTGCAGLVQVCKKSAQSPYIKIMCEQDRELGPRECNKNKCEPIKSNPQIMWCAPCGPGDSDCVPDDRFNPEKNLMSSALTLKKMIDSVGDCGKHKVMAWAAAYNMGPGWVNKALAKTDKRCDDWPNEVWPKLKEVQEASDDDELTYEKIKFKKGLPDDDRDYVGKVYYTYLSYKNLEPGTGSGIQVATTSGTPQPIEDCSEILLVGDSITVGYSKHIDCPDVDVCAKEGRSTTEMLEECFIKKDLKNKKYVVILGGVNNISNPKKVKEDLAQMYGIAKSKGISVLALTILPWKGGPGWNAQNQANTLAVNNFIKSQKLQGITVLDTYATFGDKGDTAELEKQYAAQDKKHLNDLGYLILAKTISGQLYAMKSGSGVGIAQGNTAPTQPSQPSQVSQPPQPSQQPQEKSKTSLQLAKELLEKNGFDPSLLPGDNHIISVTVVGNQISATLKGPVCSKVADVTGTLVAGDNPAHEVCFLVSPGEISPCSGSSSIYGLKGKVGFITANILKIQKQDDIYVIKTDKTDQKVAQNQLAGVSYKPC